MVRNWGLLSSWVGPHEVYSANKVAQLPFQKSFLWSLPPLLLSWNYVLIKSTTGPTFRKIIAPFSWTARSRAMDQQISLNWGMDIHKHQHQNIIYMILHGSFQFKLPKWRESLAKMDKHPGRHHSSRLMFPKTLLPGGQSAHPPIGVPLPIPIGRPLGVAEGVFK